MLKMKNVLIVLGMVLATSSCVKEEGVGGAATIKGTVTVQNVNALGTVVATYDAQDLDIYINYGTEDDTYDDKTSTSSDGTFEFKYLREGNYEIFMYAECASCPKGQDSLVTRDIVISDKKQIEDLGEIVIINHI